MRRAALVLALLLAGNQTAVAGPFNFAAMHEACEGLKQTQIVGYTACHEAVRHAEVQYPRFKAAMAEYRALPDDGRTKEAESYMLGQNKILGGFYAKLRDAYPAIWALRASPVKQAAK